MNNIKTYLNINDELKSFKIIASFASINVTPQHTKSVNYKNQLIDNVVASCVLYDKEIDFEKFHSLIELLGKHTSINNNKKTIIINVGYYSDLKASLIFNSEYLKVIDFSIYSLLKNINLNNSDALALRSKMQRIEESKVMSESNTYKFSEGEDKTLSYLIKLGVLNLLFDNENNENIESLSIEYDLIFIFNDISWDLIVSLFKLRGINLYGGSSSRRHLLSTVQARLTSFLFLLNDLQIDNNIIYRSFNEFTIYNAKIDRLIVNNIANSITGLGLLEYKKSYPDSKTYLILKHNMIMNLCLRLLSFENEINLIKYEISVLKSSLRDNENRKTILSNNYSGSFLEKKLENIIKNNNIITEKCNEHTLNLSEISKTIDIIISYLFDLEHSLFSENGEFKLIKSFKLSHTSDISNEANIETKNTNNKEKSNIVKLISRH